MNKVVKTIKTVGSLAVSVGIGAVARNIIKVTTPSDTGTVMNVCIKVGAYAIGGIASAEAGRQFGKKVDLVNEMVEKTMEKMNKEESEKVEVDVKSEDVEI
jgi:mannose/fructose/N-acetylgalactosamine-specific phosphotransferase system component IIB